MKAPLRLTFTLLLIGQITSSCIKNQPEFAQILAIEDQRQPCWHLTRFLLSSEPQIRERAVQAMGRLQDSSCVADLVKMLADVNHNVRSEAAFALGQIGSAEAEIALITRLQARETAQVKAQMTEALGKLGTKNAFTVLVHLSLDLDAEVRAAAAIATARMAQRNLRNQALTDTLSTLLQYSDAEVRWRAAYALMRIEEGLNIERIIAAASDPDPRVRMFVIQAIGNLRNYSFLDELGECLATDPDWRVRVKAANGLANFPLSLSANYLSLLDQEQPVRLVVIQAIGNSALIEKDGYRPTSREHNFARTQLEAVISATDGNGDRTEAELGHALVAYAKLLRDGAISQILPFTNDEKIRLRVRAMQALGEVRSKRAAEILAARYDAAAPAVKIAILEALKNINEVENVQVYIKALQEEDPILVALAAEGLSDDPEANRIHAKGIIAAYQRLSKPIGAELSRMIFSALAAFNEPEAVPVLETALRAEDPVVAVAAAQALQKITGQSYTEVPSQRREHSYSYEAIRKLEGAQAILETERGSIKLELFAEDAPLTVSSFVELARKGFYDNLVFHRVVPAFVIQGGDPSGNGWGGPGYSIRSEFNSRHYLRGTLGMASAGRDTEGSQFFITQSPQPHLDGRYTVFGKVISGLDVLDKIQEGDRILGVTITR